jgi:hypothetical protein
MREPYGRTRSAERWGRWGVRLGALACALTLSACDDVLEQGSGADVSRQAMVLRTTGDTVPAPPGFDPMPLAVGQWAQYEMIDAKGRSSLLTYKVLAAQHDAFWIETMHETYAGRTAQKMLVAFGSRSDPNQIDVRAVVTLDRRGHVRPVPPSMIPTMQVRFRGIVAALATDWQGGPQETTSVPAGRFEGCYHGRTEAQWGAWKSLADSWRHPAVPLSGLVRSQGLDRPFTMNLVAFGTSGATADF